MQLYHHLGDHRGEWRRQHSKEGIKICGNNNSVIGCTVSGVGGFGIFADNTNSLLIQNNTIAGTTGSGTTGHGIYVSGTTNGAVVEGNSIYNNAAVGIHLNGDVSEGGLGLVTNALIKNNLIYSNGGNAINADGLQNTTIENNVIYNYGSYGICLYQIDASGPSINNIIVNNTISSGTSSGASAAVRINDNGTGNTVLNNILLGGGGVVYRIAANSQSGFVSNYNIVPSGAQVQSDDTGAEEPFSQWQSSTGQDNNSLSATPAQLSSTPQPTTIRNCPPARRSGPGRRRMRRVRTPSGTRARAATVTTSAATNTRRVRLQHRRSRA